MNNYEKIKAMSPEEMAEAIITQDFCGACKHEKNGICVFMEEHEGEPLYNGCHAACLTWLKRSE